MKKLLFTFFGLILFTSLGWGATVTDVYSIGDTAIAKSWVKNNAYTPLYLGANITITANHLSTASVTNGVYSYGTVSGATEYRWYIYKADTPGFTISIDNKYWIKSISVKNNPQNGGVLVEKESQNEVKANGTAFPVNAQAITCQVISGTSGNICARITQISVTYDEAPTGVTLNVPDAMNATVGNKFQIAATVAPSSTVFKTIKWTTSNAAAVDVDQNGVIDVKGAGQATITATTVNGKTATCVIDATATTDEFYTEDYAKLGEQATLKSSYTQFDGVYGQLWRVRNFIHSSATELSSGVSGVAIQGGATNFVAFANANVEGGVKRVAFKWRAVDATKPVNFDVDDPADATSKLTTRLIANSDYANVQSYSRDVEMKKNYQLRIMVANNASSNIVVGPVTITPYLLYKTKQAEATGTYKNEDLINNTGATPTFTLENNDGEASIADDGTVTCLKEGEVTVKASWNEGKVYTTYTLTTHVKPIPVITFGNTTIDAFGSYTPEPKAKLNDVEIPDAQWNYTSSNAAVATVNEGVFTITGAGTSTITATLVEGETYASTSATATLTINAPTAGVWKETFKSLPDTSTTYNMEREKFKGDNGVYNWAMRYYMRKSGNADKVNGEPGIRLVNGDVGNYIEFDGKQEGGIKDVFFYWRRPAADDPANVRFTLQVISGENSKDTIQRLVKTNNVPGGTSFLGQCIQNFNVDENAKLKFLVSSGGNPIIFGPFTVKPYLLYTTKDTMVSVTAGTFTNDKLIDNRDNDENIEYSIKSSTPAGIASVENNVVTFNAGGDVTVQAKWGKVTTTYKLHINRLDMPTLTFEDGDAINKTMNDVPFNNKLNGLPESGIGTVTYSSTKPKVADVDNNGLVTIYGAGTTTITATITDGAIYSAASKSYTLEVSEPSGEVSYTETFKAYEDEGWDKASDIVTTKEGDYFKWDVYRARHDKARDSLFNKSRATWLSNNSDGAGYIRTKDTLQGGIKRISFKWNKLTQGSKRALFALFWTEDNTGYDQVDVNVETGATETLHDPDFDYSHNFFLKRNVPLRIVNSKNNALLELGDIKITPYIFFKTRNAEISYEAYYQVSPYTNPGYINNTNGEGTITFTSSNPSIANPKNDGSCAVEILGSSEEPITITASWKPSDDAEACTASYQLIIHGKDKRKAEFEKDSVTVKVGETPVNEFSCKEKATATISYSSSETTVATINGSEVNVVGIGTTIIKAKVEESTYFMADSATYVLVVKPTEDAEHTLAESFNGVAFIEAAQQDLQGDLHKYGVTWDKNDVLIRRGADDLIGGKQGTWMRQAALLNTSDVMEGGVKYFSCYWRQPFTESNTTIKVGLFLDDAEEPVFATSDRRINDVAGAGSEQQYYYAANVAHKSNAKLTFKNLSNNSDATRGRIIFDTLKVVPYLFYTAKDTTLVANEMGGVYTFTNDKLIDNTEDAVADNFTYKVLAKDNAVSIADEHSDVLTIKGAGTDTIQAAWDGVTTTYVVHVELLDANLAFEKDSTVLLSAGTCQQVATKSTTATVTYGFEGDHEGASIAQDGTVTFTQTGVFHIIATVPVDLPYDKDTARYILTVNDKETPSITFNDVEKDMNAVPFQNPMNEIYTGLGQAHYTSTDPAVAAVVESTGWITIVGQGDATINVHFDDGDDWAAADASFEVSVSDPGDAKLKENFVKQNNWGTSATSIDGNLFKWNVNNTRRNVNKEKLANGDSAVWFSNTGNSWIESQKVIEGGIKRVSFYYNKYDNNTVNLKFTMAADGVVVDSACQANVSGEPRAAEDFWFNHNLLIKDTVKLRIAHPVSGVTAHLGYINITPYLYYKTRKDTLDLKTGETTFKNEDLIDNRDDKDNPLSKIEYAIIAGNEIATIDADGLVTATGSGEVTVQAKWSTYEKVVTTYVLTILPTKTTIKLMHNDGTDGYNTIENTIGAQIEADVIIPERTGYRFNAYFYDAAASASNRRMTATNTEGKTQWIDAVRTFGGVPYINSRVWVYPGAECSLYANWMPERKIALDNLDETTPDTVYTAICANNDAVNLKTPVTVPEKTGYTFLGYYTDAEDGIQIVGADGAFKANVEGYTNNKTKWQKDVEITTLYAHWEAAITLKDTATNNKALLTPLVTSGNPTKVNLVRRFTAGEYNTICLPFDVNEETMIAKFGENYQLATLDISAPASLDNAHKNLSITIVPQDTIKAGMPYLIKLESSVQDPSFENVVIKCDEGATIGESDVTFVGIFGPKLVPTDKSVLFVVSNDKLAWNATGAAKNMNGIRAYFHVDGITNISGITPRLMMRQPQTPTELMQNAECTMQGVQKVLINEQIYIIRNGVRYNVNGQIIK